MVYARLDYIGMNALQIVSAMNHTISSTVSTINYTSSEEYP
jgi:hypothetical protein